MSRGELPVKFGKVLGNLWIAVKFHSERTSGGVAGELPGKLRGLPEARGILNPSQPCWPRIARYRETISAIPPYCALWGFGCLNRPVGCVTPSPFSERFLLGEHAKWRCDTPHPHKRGISAILARYLRDTL